MTVAVVTGGGAGIGAAICRRLAQGAAVAVWDVSAGSAQATAEAIENAGGRATAIAVDVANPQSVRAALSETAAALGTPAVLVNCAGVRDDAALQDHDLESWRRVLAVNLDGCFFCSRELVRGLPAGEGGAIVNIASINGLLAGQGRPAYVASKTAIIALTRSLALELGPRGVRVNAIAPGHIVTPYQRRQRGHQVLAGMETLPLGRSGQPEEMAEIAAFLAGPQSSYVTGAVVVADGGWTSTAIRPL